MSVGPARLPSVFRIEIESSLMAQITATLADAVGRIAAASVVCDGTCGAGGDRRAADDGGAGAVSAATAGSGAAAGSSAGDACSATASAGGPATGTTAFVGTGTAATEAHADAVAACAATTSSAACSPCCAARLEQVTTCVALLQALPSCGMFSLAASLLSSGERKRAVDAAMAAVAVAGTLSEVVGAGAAGAASDAATRKASICTAADVVCKAFK